MTGAPDYDLNLGGEPPRPPLMKPQRSPFIGIAIAAAILAIAVGAYVWLARGTPETTTAPPPSETSEAVAPARPPGADVEPIKEQLDQSDPAVRKLVAALSSHPRVAAWLATNGLIRNFVVVVENISTGTTPARHLRVLRPARPFRVMEANDEIAVDPRSYERYTDIAAAAASIDAAGAARVYASLKPRIEEAYAELGRQEPFDRALERAISALLQVPVVAGIVRLEETGATEYKYADARLEQLTEAQKQLLRMGPGNVRTIQAKLREIALALGIPARG
jgi:hypothetical protein